jgi:hypothetical protein
MKINWSPDSENPTAFSMVMDNMEGIDSYFDDEEPTQVHMVYCAEEYPVPFVIGETQAPDSLEA